MLGLRLDLTPAQVKTLLLLRYGKRQWMTNTDGREVHYLPLELSYESTYLLTFSALVRRNLAVQTDSGPELTKEGESICDLIYFHAKNITDLVENSLSHSLVDLEKENNQ